MAVSAIFGGPEWFFGIDSILETVAAIILFFVFLFGMKMYSMLKERKYAVFAAGFGFMTLGTLVRAFTNWIVHSQWHFFEQLALQGIMDIGKIFVVGYTTHIFLMLIGYILLLSHAVKIQKKRFILLMILTSIILITFSSSYFMSFYTYSIVLLAFITYHFFENCRKTKAVAARNVLIAFAFVTAANIQFLLELVHNIFYVTGYATLFLGYALLGIALLRVVRKK